MNNDTERLEWLANTVLCSDYGDNHHPDREIGWRVMEFISPVIYGKSIREAIDKAMDTEASRKRLRSARTSASEHE